MLLCARTCLSTVDASQVRPEMKWRVVFFLAVDDAVTVYLDQATQFRPVLLPILPSPRRSSAGRIGKMCGAR